MAKQFYIVDGHWQIFRAYYAPFRALTSTTGEPTKATYVFTTMMLKLITERRPEYLAVALDSGREGLHRTAIYPQYKEQRAASPEDFAPQVRRIIQIIGLMGIPILQLPGVEADDIIATAVRECEGGHIQPVLVSRDKDLDQLLTRGAVMYDPISDEVIDGAKLLQTKGFRPEDALEIQSLCGDSTDNVPGVPGIGPKTAIKLISQYGSVAGVLAHLDKLTPKLAQNLREHTADIELTRKLVSLDDHVKLDLTPERFAFRGIPVEQLRPIFTELGFGRVLDQLAKLDSSLVAGGKAADGKGPAKHPKGGKGEGGLFAAPPSDEEVARMAQEAAASEGKPAPASAAAPAPAPAAPAKPTSYRCVDTPKALDDLLAELRGAKRLAVGCQSTDSRAMWGELVGVSLGWAQGQAAYVPIRGPLGEVTLDGELVARKLAPLLADADIEKIGHDLKFSLIVLGSAGMPLAGPLFDVMLAAYVLDAGRSSYNLENLAGELLGHRCTLPGDLVGRGRDQRKMNEVPTQHLMPFACEVVDMSLALRDLLGGQLAGEGLTKLFENIEMALMPVLADMERIGVRIDLEELHRQEIVLSRKAEELRGRIIAASGRDFNPDSPRQLAEVLYTHLKLPVIKKTKTGPSTDSSVLVELSAMHEAPALVLDYRQATKLLSTYLVALAQCCHGRTGRIHTTFNQTGTTTGRLSSSDPNLQNIPIRTELGRSIRAAFVADKGHMLISADYSQVELRILAHYCQDETLLAAFHSDQDIHRIVAAEVFRVAPEEVTGAQRARAKTVNFGIIYGQTAFGLSATLRIPRREAQEFIDSYKARFPKIENFLAQCIEQARAQGYVETLAGRRRRIGGLESANPQLRALAGRLAINSVVQGSAADLIKIAMIRIHRRLLDEHRPMRMILQIHDELLFESPDAAVEQDRALVAQEMTTAMQLRVPLKVDLGVGRNWLEAK